MKPSDDHIQWWRWDPLGLLTGMAWAGLFLTFAFTSELSDFGNAEPHRFAAHALAFLAGQGFLSVARLCWTRRLRWPAILLGAAPWLITAVLALLFVASPWVPALGISATVGALSSVAMLGAHALGYWVLLAAACATYVRNPSALTLLALLGVAVVAALGLVESSARVVLTRFMWQRDPSQRGRPWFFLRSRIGLGTAALATVVLISTWWAVSRGAAAYQSALSDASHDDPARPGSRRSREREGVDQWMQSVSLGSSAAQKSDEVLAEVALRDGRSGEPVRDGRTLYFPVTTLDEFGADRMSRSATSAPESLVDHADGADDGWIEFERPRAGAPLITATVTQHATATARAGLAPLLRLEPLLAVRIDALSRLDDGALLAELESGRLEYALAADPRVARLPPDHAGPAWHVDPRYLALPQADPALARIAQRAREVAASAGSDAQRTLALVAHFRDGFTYSDEGTGAEGLEGLARLLERRSGYCAAIAAACVLMLRSEGIPSRAVAGLLGSEFDPESDLYVLRQRHGHAWVEAHFEGLGWVRLDPTPPSAQPSAAARGVFDPLADWGEGVRADLASFVRGDAGGPGLAQLALRLSDGPAALARSAREGQPLALAVAALLLAIMTFFVARALRRTVIRVRSSRSSPGRALAFEERLIEALRTRGAQVRASRTLREIAESASARIEQPLAASLRQAIRKLEAVRFGGEELEREQRRELEELLEQLRAP